MAVWLSAIPAAAICWFIHFWYRSRHGRATRGSSALAFSVLTLAFVALAMMRPQLQSEQRTPTFERRDLFVILDRSVSMRARDVPPSRFGRAVQDIQQFLRQKPDTIDRVALIGFAGASVVLSYPTEDVDSLSFYLDWAHEDVTPLFGTDIGGALSSALAAARRERSRVPPVFVVISDGEDQSGRLAGAAAAVSSAGIRVHCIGIGSDAAVPMPVSVSEGREEFLRDDYGEIVTTSFNGATLQRLAAATGGRYFRSAGGAGLLTALDNIAADDRRQIGWKTSTAYRDVYLLPLAAAAVTSLVLMMLL